MPSDRLGPGEFERIRRLTAGLPAGEGVIVGPGDDAAVLRPTPGRDLVATTDAFVEGRHFIDGLFGSGVVARRLAAANLSDVAAMAAIPRWALLSAGLPRDRAAGDSEAFQHAFAAALAAEGAAVVGGNLAASDGPTWWSVTLIGEVEPGLAWTRSGARPGHLLAMTGSPGRAAALTALARWGNPPSAALAPEPLVATWSAPPCRVRAARALAATGGVRAAIDVSDGVAGDLAHVCAASGVGAEIDAVAWPADALLASAAETLAGLLVEEREGLRPPDAATLAERLRLGPSDDYELLLAVDPARRGACERAAREAGCPLAFIGRFTAEAGERWLVRAGEREPLSVEGYDHFR